MKTLRNIREDIKSPTKDLHMEYYDFIGRTISTSIRFHNILFWATYISVSRRVGAPVSAAIESRMTPDLEHAPNTHTP